jgi:hypothetical protein
MYPSIWPTGYGLAALLRASPAAPPSNPPCPQPSPWPLLPPRRMKRLRPNYLGPPSCRALSLEPSAAFREEKPRPAPDFLSNLLRCRKLMRFSLRKTAHVAPGERRAAGNPGSLAALIHPKFEHKSVPWVQDTAGVRNLWCVEYIVHTDSPSALTGFPVKLGDVGETHANVAGAARQEIRAQGAFFCSRRCFRWVHTEATRRDAVDALRCSKARGNPMSGSRK